MSIYVSLLLLAILVVYVVDLSGFADTLRAWASTWIGRKVARIKPFDCSLCMTWWVGIIYAAIAGQFTLPVIAYVAGLSFASSLLGGVLRLAWDALAAIIARLSTFIDEL